MKIFTECRTCKDQGNIGLAKAIYELQLLGYRISIPITENQEYDLIGDKDNKLYRIQVKTTRCKSKYGVYCVNLRTLGGNRSFHTIKKHVAGNYELLYVLTEENDSYLIPDSEIMCVNRLALSKNILQYKIKK